jgi:hypothetical protein
MPKTSDGVNPQTYSLVRDKEQFWGHSPEGEPLTREGYQSRFVLPPLPGGVYGPDYYPPNNGAMPDTRIHFTSLAAMVGHYGDTVDRIGPETGSVMTLRIDGFASFFDQRSLPVTAMWERYFTYSLNPDVAGGLPDGWVLELSKAAPAFGRDGGGIHLRFFNEVGNDVSVTDLRDLGILKK